MKFGLVKTSLIDYPGEVAAVLFTRGCNLRCPYCHNPELITGSEPRGMLEPERVLDFLRSRRKVLGGVVVTGGEPLLHPEIPDFLAEVRRLGLKVKLDTNGTLPDALKAARADYIAMDIKTLPEKYAILSSARPIPGSGAFADIAEPPNDLASAVRESVRFVIRSGADHEFRTTAAPGVFGADDIDGLAELLRGARRYIITNVRTEETLDPEYGKNREPYTREALLRMRQAFRMRGIECHVRGISGEGT
jgi:pyruvate formate lyase activating enzyme